ncbi:DUF4198 domain-containing protein [Undibacterium jejuense]|uniref:DUF4198 domain-containing protein n=1 Tax=Undibacterium jejuense TaxID=1344949 RepID=A0A923HH79_9BURK|nr:DUF4198 domain-containing protein [Undibacterium jejuense]MBC3862368.1 DUF4198 domain-containing protein [Undibacterium jejuense]
MSFASSSFIRQTITICVLACTSLTAHAHHPFLVPSSTVVSGDAPWVLVDAGAASNVFEFDHAPLQFDNLGIIGPDGRQIAPDNITRTRFRNSFELQLKQVGSYKVDILNQGFFATYKDQGEIKRWRGAASAISKEIPATATELQINERISRVETIVTNGKPGGKAMDANGKGLELAFISHPNDLVEGETAHFRLLLDGKPAANVPVEIIPGGKRYRQQLENQSLVTDKDGNVNVNWKNAGLYWLQAEVKDNNNATPPATSRIASFVITLEVLPQ